MFNNNYVQTRAVDYWKIYQLNFRGYNSKKYSFESILKGFDKMPDVLVISESHLQSSRNLKVPNYSSYTRNRKGKKHGGIATSVLNSEVNQCLKVSEGANDNEYIVTRHSQFLTPLNVINIYGEQETRTPVDEIRDHWNEIVQEIIKIEARNEHVVIIGDFNKHIGDLVKGNHDKVSEGGKIIREFLLSEKYVLLNGTESVIGGPFTRLEPSDPTNDRKKSCLDLIIVSKDLVRYVDNVFIDRERKVTPAHAMKNKKLTYPDHYAIVTTFKNMPRTKDNKSLKPPKAKLWNTNKEGGWKKFYNLTQENKVLEKVSTSAKFKGDPEKAMNTIDKEMTNVKFSAFGKVKYRDESSVSRRLVKLQAEKNNCNESERIEELNVKIAEELEKGRKESLEKDLKRVNDLKKKRKNSSNI